jgi:hypothetical protein
MDGGMSDNEGIAVKFYAFVHACDEAERKRLGNEVADALARLERRVSVLQESPIRCRCHWVPAVISSGSDFQVRCSNDYCWNHGPVTATEREAIQGWNDQRLAQLGDAA